MTTRCIAIECTVKSDTNNYVIEASNFNNKVIYQGQIPSSNTKLKYHGQTQSSNTKVKYQGQTLRSNTKVKRRYF